MGPGRIATWQESRYMEVGVQSETQCKWRYGPIRSEIGCTGFSQALGIDYFETYAPVAKLTTYPVTVALAALEPCGNGLHHGVSTWKAKRGDLYGIT